MPQPQERTITVGGIPVTIRTTNRTTLDTYVTTHGDVVVRAPHGTTDTQAIDLVERRRTWIYNRLTDITENTPEDPTRHLTNGETFHLFGHPHKLRIVPDSKDEQPVTRFHFTTSRSEIRLHRSHAINPNKARRTLTHFYAEAGQKWLKDHGAHITRLTNNPDIPLTTSTRLRTTWITHHPTHGITLHWATAQLPTPLLRELLHRTLTLHTIANTHELDRTLPTLWTGSLTTTPHTTTPTPSDNCPECSTPPNTLHTNWCDIARCALTGMQRHDCHPNCNTIWTGTYPGQAECEEYGFYWRMGPNGYEHCNADTPGADHDFNRLYNECTWDVATQRMTLST
ncbi:M48 family metallopeptidase [Streptomyces sp. NBC_00237]|uniref:YgjP-like metallopeptidase domain-containing protein n=1 Tax=Streptomyces sp. NBC_00237 TaxID=2975687 RepID=UPI0022511307|nr:YgjP-like metallopeptidase domain-containing protein [Streptomyces sp. NBC_00237]MCX5206681.1 M48 family metallopeptidase [Streptomyces sp. NBC_00237]